MCIDDDENAKQSMSTVFISGSRNISRLNDQIRERLQNMMRKELKIVVGDANGADKAMQLYLADQKYLFVTVFCSDGKCRNNVGSWPVEAIDVDPQLKGRAFYTVKDKAMAEAAEYGFILWDGESKGSISNAETLLEAGKKVALYHAPSKGFVHLKAPRDLDPLLTDRPAPKLKAKFRKACAESQVALPFGKAS